MELAISDRIVGTTIDRRYKVLADVGTGLHSRVLKAEDMERSGIVALKILNDSVVTTKSFDRYRLWAEHALTLVHPNIVRVASCETGANNQIYQVTDFVEATDLKRILSDHKRLPENVAISIMSQACDALDHAHSKGIPHSNLKPNNVMLIAAGDSYMVKLSDFGVISPKNAVRKGDGPKTDGSAAVEQYLSPEQKDGRWTDARSDLYAVGCLLYECLTGKALATGAVKQSITGNQQVVPPLPSDLTKKGPLTSILARALARNPKERYQQAREMSSDLSLLLEVGSAEWESKAHCLRPVVPIKQKSPGPAFQLNFDLRMPLAILGGLIAIPVGGLITISVLDIKVEALMPWELAVQERVFAPTDPRLLKNLAYMIEYYKSQRKYAEAWAYKSKVIKATEKPLTEEEGGLELLDLQEKAQ